MKMNKYGRIDRDAWFTPVKISNLIVKKLLQDYPQLYTYDFIEPSAGNGSFIKGLKNNGIDKKQIIGFDIYPQGKKIIKQDFLKYFPTSLVFVDNVFVIGNPPYGNRNKLAIDFIKHSFDLGAEYVGFLLQGSANTYTFFKKVGYKVDKVYILPKFKFLVGDKSISRFRTVNDVFVVFKNDALQDNNIIYAKYVYNIKDADYVYGYNYFKKVDDILRNETWLNGKEKCQFTNSNTGKKIYSFIKSKNFNVDLFKSLQLTNLSGKPSLKTYNFYNNYNVLDTSFLN